jgi:hypothetical protein
MGIQRKATKIKNNYGNLVATTRATIRNNLTIILFSNRVSASKHSSFFSPVMFR